MVDEFGEGSRTGQSDFGIAPPSLPSCLSPNQAQSDNKIYDMVYSSANPSFERVGERPARNATPKGRRVTTSQDAAPWARFSVYGRCQFLCVLFRRSTIRATVVLSSSGLPPMGGVVAAFLRRLGGQNGDLRFAVCNRSDLKTESPGNGTATA